MPLLFTEAFHATVDVPETVRDVTGSLPLTWSSPTSWVPATTSRACSARTWAAGIDDESSVLLFGVGSSRPAANEAVFDLAGRLRDGRPRPVRACFGTCSPGVADVLDGLPEPVAIVPLFLSEGLLLSPVRELASQHGWRMAEPLGERAADLVREHDSAWARRPF